MSDARAHCVPFALVVMAVCVYWLQETPWLQAASGSIVATHLVGIDNGARGMLAAIVVSPEMGIPRKTVRGVITPPPWPGQDVAPLHLHKADGKQLRSKGGRLGTRRGKRRQTEAAARPTALSFAAADEVPGRFHVHAKR